MAKSSRAAARERRHARVRKKLQGTPGRPRLNIFRSLEHIYAQIIDDEAGVTLVSASTIDRELRAQLAQMRKSEQAKEIGKAVAERAKAKVSSLLSLIAVAFPIMDV